MTASPLPPAAPHGPDCVGWRVGIWSMDQEKYFNGEIKSFDEKSGKHLVKYDSGEQRLMTIEQSKTKWLSKSQIQGEDAVGWRVSVGPPGHLSGSDPLFLFSSHSPLG